MKREEDPITDDEWLLRRVPRDKFRPDQTPIVRPSAFEPRGPKSREPDHDGISFFRKSCLGSPEDALATLPPDKLDDTAIVQVQVAQIKQLKLNDIQLSVVSKKDDRIKGHVLIPQLNVVALQNSRELLTPIMKAIAEFASKPSNIVRRPQSSPPATP